MTKKLLILQASEDISDAEVLNIASQADMYGVKSTINKIKTRDDLRQALHTGTQYDYIYLCTHGDNECFGNSTGTLNMTWLEFGVTVCSANCTTKDSIFMLSCCRGGLNQVAYDMFLTCGKIQYLCGPRQNVRPVDLVIGFNIFLYNIEVRRMDPIVAAQKVLQATDIRFKCFDRMETETEVGFIEYRQSVDQRLDQLWEQEEEYEQEN